MDENVISKCIVASAIEVHRTLGGAGLLESVYEEALVHELNDRGLDVERQVMLPIYYKGQKLATSLRLDLRVQGLVLVEVKATVESHPIFISQMLTYLRTSRLKLGIVINFGERLVNEGIQRVANGMP